MLQRTATNQQFGACEVDMKVCSEECLEALKAKIIKRETLACLLQHNTHVIGDDVLSRKPAPRKGMCVCVLLLIVDTFLQQTCHQIPQIRILYRRTSPMT
jgi:hypothetical protein